MAMEMERHCETCGEPRTFWRVASTTVHLGTKVKWHCNDCGDGFVRIDDDVDSGADA